MTDLQSQVELHMQALVQQWEQASDQRAVFLRCYMMMTENMSSAIEADKFNDGVWVRKLLQYFAEYYFGALAAYEQNPPTAPPAWQVAFDTAQNPAALVLHHLLLGVNAHITYDLVLTLVDLLAPEWATLSANERQQRRADYDYVNTVIGQTIDAVQDSIVERALPAMDIVDRLMGPVDEWMVSTLITHWRDYVWQEAIRLIETNDPQERASLRQRIEARTLRRADAILGRDGLTIADLI